MTITGNQPGYEPVIGRQRDAWGCVVDGRAIDQRGWSKEEAEEEERKER